MESIDTAFKTLQQNLSTLHKLSRNMNDDLKSLQKAIRVADKSRNKNRVKKPQTKMNVDKKLLTFLGHDNNVQLTRAEVMKQLSTYVKDHNLQIKTDKKRFKPNSNLCKLFNITVKSVKPEGMTFVEINKYISQYLTKTE
tara:strand:+ start:3350 stop:3769 length:420 start_codon:yes stop_codon:yes gene_type:complete